MWLLFASSVGPIIANALIWLASHIALLPRWVKPIGWVAAAGVAVGVLLLTLIRLYYRKSASQIISLYGSAYMVGLSARRRRFVRNWIAAVATLSTFGFLGWKYYENRIHRPVVILVADFEKADPQYRVTRLLVENLENATKQYEDVEIERLGKFIPWEDGIRIASNEGSKRRAAVVLWGDYDKTATHAKITVHFQTPKGTAVPAIHLEQESETLTVPVSELDELFDSGNCLEANGLSHAAGRWGCPLPRG